MKRLKLKISIENKILILFLIISFLFTGVFASILGYNSYHAQLEKEKLNARVLLESVTCDIDYYGKISDEQTVLDVYSWRGYRELYIYDQSGAALLEGDTRLDMQEEWVLQTRDDNSYGWSLCYIIDRAAFYDQLIENQKYMILATIALLIITVQAGIFTAYNISNPIRLLSNTCESISRNPNIEAVGDFADTFEQRTDEIGLLATSFSRMLTDIRHYNAEVMRVNSLNKAIVENLPLGVVAYDTNGKQLCINSKANAMLGDEGYTCNGIALMKVIEEMMRKNSLVIDPIRASDSFGKKYDLEIGIWQLTDAEGFTWGALCTIDDITYKKMMEEKFSESEKLAYTGKISADLAHEIRNPLAGIRASIQVIAKRMEAPNDKALCSSMVGEVDRINLLIENLLNIARERTSQKTLFQVGRLFDEISLLYTKVAENSRIELGFSCEAGIELFADESQIKQVLINLINNSFKAIKNGGRVSVAANRLPEGVMLTVEDNGTGMSEREIENILSTGHGKAGRGLGISIVKRLLAQNSGNLEIISTVGSGTKIIIIF